MSDEPKTNTIISIGYLGSMRCYLNVPRDEAIRRYIEAEGPRMGHENIEEVTVTDEW